MLAVLLLSTQALAGTTGTAGSAWRPSWLGPRLNLGLAVTRAGNPVENALQPGAWTGTGARLGTGLSLGIGPQWGLVAEVGYHSLFGTPTAEVDREMTNSVRTSALHLGYGWVAVEALVGKVRFAIGPEWAAGGGVAIGAANCLDCSEVVGDGSRQRLLGTIRAGGATGAVSFSLMEQGGFSGALGIISGALTDAVRWYPWGEVALVVTPTPSRRN